MTLKLWLRLLMYTPVNFRTSGNVDKTGEVVFMGDGKVGIATQREVFSYKEVKRVRRVHNGGFIKWIKEKLF